MGSLEDFAAPRVSSGWHRALGPKDFHIFTPLWSVKHSHYKTFEGMGLFGAGNFHTTKHLKKWIGETLILHGQENLHTKHLKEWIGETLIFDGQENIHTTKYLE